MSSKSRKGQIMASKEKRRKMESRKIKSMFKSTTSQQGNASEKSQGRQHFTTTRIAKIKKTTSIDENVEKLESS